MCNVAKVHSNAMREVLTCAQDMTLMLTTAIDSKVKMAEEVHTSRENAISVITHGPSLKVIRVQKIKI